MIPALSFAAVASLLMSFSLRQAVALGEAAEQVALGRQVTVLVHELQNARDWTAELLSQAGLDGREQLPESLAPHRDAVDEAVAAFEVASWPLRARPGLAGGIGEAQAALAELDAVRTGVDEGWLHELAVFDGYGRAIETLVELLQAPPQAQEQTRGLRELTESKELRSQVRGRVHAVTGAGRFRLGEASALVDTLAQHQAAVGRFQGAAAPAQVARFDQVVRGQAVATTARLEAIVLEQTDAARLEAVNPERWWSAATTELELVREWRRCCRALGDHEELDLLLLTTDGEHYQIDPGKLTAGREALRALRAHGYQPERGTWFTMSRTIRPDGESWSPPSRHRQPLWTTPPEPKHYLQEMARFPRRRAEMPAWLRVHYRRARRPWLARASDGAAILCTVAAGAALAVLAIVVLLSLESSSLAGSPAGGDPVLGEVGA